MNSVDDVCDKILGVDRYDDTSVICGVDLEEQPSPEHISADRVLESLADIKLKLHSAATKEEKGMPSSQYFQPLHVGVEPPSQNAALLPTREEVEELLRHSLKYRVQPETHRPIVVPQVMSATGVAKKEQSSHHQPREIQQPAAPKVEREPRSHTVIFQIQNPSSQPANHLNSPISPVETKKKSLGTLKSKNASTTQTSNAGPQQPPKKQVVEATQTISSPVKSAPMGMQTVGKSTSSAGFQTQGVAQRSEIAQTSGPDQACTAQQTMAPEKYQSTTQTQTAGATRANFTQTFEATKKMSSKGLQVETKIIPLMKKGEAGKHSNESTTEMVTMVEVEEPKVESYKVPTQTLLLTAPMSDKDSTNAMPLMERVEASVVGTAEGVSKPVQLRQQGNRPSSRREDFHTSMESIYEQSVMQTVSKMLVHECVTSFLQGEVERKSFDQSEKAEVEDAYQKDGAKVLEDLLQMNLCSVQEVKLKLETVHVDDTRPAQKQLAPTEASATAVDSIRLSPLKAPPGKKKEEKPFITKETVKSSNYVHLPSPYPDAVAMADFNAEAVVEAMLHEYVNKSTFMQQVPALKETVEEIKPHPTEMLPGNQPSVKGVAPVHSEEIRRKDDQQEESVSKADDEQQRNLKMKKEDAHLAFLSEREFLPEFVLPQKEMQRRQSPEAEGEVKSQKNASIRPKMQTEERTLSHLCEQECLPVVWTETKPSKAVAEEAGFVIIVMDPQEESSGVSRAEKATSNQVRPHLEETRKPEREVKDTTSAVETQTSEVIQAPPHPEAASLPKQEEKKEMPQVEKANPDAVSQLIVDWFSRVEGQPVPPPAAHHVSMASSSSFLLSSTHPSSLDSDGRYKFLGVPMKRKAFQLSNGTNTESTHTSVNTTMTSQTSAVSSTTKSSSSLTSSSGTSTNTSR